MSSHVHPPRLVLGAAAAIGLSADLLLRVAPPGLNWAVWLLLLPGSLLILSRLLARPLVGDARLAGALSIACATGFLWRDAPGLTVLNLLAAVGGWALMAVRTSSRTLRSSSVFELLHAMMVHLVHTIAGTGFLIARELRPEGGNTTPERRRVPSVLRGVAVAVPVTLLFGSLFVSADASFERLAGHLLDVDIPTLFTHLALICFVSWITAGFLRGSLIAEEVPAPATLREAFFSLGIIEVGIPLAALDALFLLFVVLQVPYLFGGAAAVASTPPLTYAAYFRRGFFELTAVSCFTLPTLLFSEWILRKESRREIILFRGLAGVNLILLGVIMASAWQRFLLYQEAYGLTEARIYAAAILTGIALVAIWFGYTVLRGRRDRFAFGAILAAYTVLLALNALNPDALIARVNIARAAEGKPLDPAYLSRLSADATPELIRALPQMNSRDAAIISRSLLERSRGNAQPDLRTWNWSRGRSAEEIGSHQELLTRLSREAAGAR